MKATTIVTTVAGALFISALAFAGTGSKQIHSAKPATAQKVSGMAAHPAKKPVMSASATKRATKPVMKQAKHSPRIGTTAATKVAAKKTAAQRRIHHVKHQPGKTDAQKQMQKKS